MNPSAILPCNSAAGDVMSESEHVQQAWSNNSQGTVSEVIKTFCSAIRAACFSVSDG